jgi:hypothetical protein
MAIVGTSPQGWKLCEACWSGAHWTKGKNGHKAINHCQHGGCQCLCPQMPNDTAAINLAMKKRRAENRAAQIRIPDVGAGYKHVNPTDKHDL